MPTIADWDIFKNVCIQNLRKTPYLKYSKTFANFFFSQLLHDNKDTMIKNVKVAESNANSTPTFSNNKLLSYPYFLYFSEISLALLASIINVNTFGMFAAGFKFNKNSDNTGCNSILKR